MPKSKSRRKKQPKRVLALPDLEQAKMAVLNSLTSAGGQRTYDHAIAEFVAWYYSEPPPRLQPHRRAPIRRGILAMAHRGVTHVRGKDCVHPDIGLVIARMISFPARESGQRARLAVRQA
jgi:hypothetical protein